MGKGKKGGEKKRKEIKYSLVVQCLPRRGPRLKLPSLQIEPHPWHSPVFSPYDTSYISKVHILDAHMYLSNKIYLFCVYKHFACIYVCESRVCMVPEEFESGYRMP